MSNCDRYSRSLNSRFSARALGGRPLGVAVAHPVAQIGGLSVLKRLELAGADVAPVAHDAHEFVVADERVHAPASGRRFALESDEEIHHLPRVRSAIEHVTRLHQARPASNPPLASVDQSGRTQHAHKPVVCAVDVPDGHDPLRGRDVTRKLGRTTLSARQLGARPKIEVRARPRLHWPTGGGGWCASSLSEYTRRPPPSRSEAISI